MTAEEAQVALNEAHTLHQDYMQAPAAHKLPALTRAIQLYEAALAFCVEADSMEAFGGILNNLGSAYCQLPGGDREENLRQAIHCYEQALLLRTRQAFPADWARIQNNLGNTYRQLPGGDREGNLRQAIHCYEQALQVHTRQAFPADWAATQHDLGNAYSGLFRGDREGNLRQAIHCYEQALQVHTRQAFPADWAATQHHLGNAYGDLPGEDREGSLRQAIHCYEQALQVRTRHAFPAQWAMTQNSLGVAYSDLPGEDREGNLRQAIHCYEQALQVRTRQAFPAQWATTQNNLGIAYRQLPGGDREGNVRQAIHCYEQALQVRTRQAFPADWAATQNNLGRGYSELPGGDREGNLRQAIHCYEQALLVYTCQAFPAHWAGIQNNLGNAYSVLPGEDREGNLRQAIQCYEQALQVRTRQAFPAHWAATQNNLGNTYRRLPGGDREGNLRQAIHCYEQALQVHTRQAFPAHWAGTENNLGNAYGDLPGEDREGNLRQAIHCYEQALQVHTRQAFPADCLRTLHNLGHLHYKEGAWRLALASYCQAVEVTEQVRLHALRAASRRRILQESAGVFERAVACARQLGQLPLALTLAERGKTRALADHLWQREVRPSGVAEERWQQYQRLLAEAVALEQALSAGEGKLGGLEAGEGTAAPRSQQALLERLQGLRQASAALEEEFRAADPDYLPFAKPLKLRDLADLTRRARAVLVELHVGEDGTTVFLLGPGEEDLGEEQVLHLPALNAGAVEDLLVRFEGEQPVDGWLMQYLRFRHRESTLDDWLQVVDSTTRLLDELLLAPVRRRLRQRYPKVERLLLVPSKGLTVLPLTAAWWTDEAGQRRYLLDDYDIACVPSCQVLRTCLDREGDPPARARRLFAVQNPDAGVPGRDLPFADWEVEEVSRHFAAADRRVLAGAAATAAAVKGEMAFGDEKLFSCHGVFEFGAVERSRLLLAGDDVLAVPDVMTLSLRGTWLAVLSACETGLTDFRERLDEYQGLPAAFLAAGAGTVVPSLWAVSDASTALLMRRFHANLYEEKMAKATALREAQRWLRDLSEDEVVQLLEAKQQELLARMAVPDLAGAKFAVRRLARTSTDRPFANPYWWAAFQCVGAGWVPEPPSERVAR